MTTAVHQDHAYNYGCLALEYCNKRLPLTVLKTRAYYIGTLDATDGLPCSRESVEYLGFHAQTGGNFRRLPKQDEFE